MSKINRRSFMVGCSAAIAAMAGGRLSYVAFGSPEQEFNQDIFLVIFLRGGADGLSIVPVMAGDDRGYYEANRERLAIPVTGTNAAINLDGFFGLHPAAAPLHELYQDGKLAIVHAAGLTSDTRSHFDAMKYMELGTPGSKAATTGWLTRHMQTAGNLPEEIILPALAVGNLQPDSLSGSSESVGMDSPEDFDLNGHWRYGDWQRYALRQMYAGSGLLHEAGIQTLDAVDVLEYGNPGTYEPTNGAVYPNNSFGRNLQAVAQIIKMQLGMRVATIDLGGWDSHEYQGDSGAGYFAEQMTTVSQGLHAFCTDLSGTNGTNHGSRVTTVVMSEFGRSLKENGSRGTDHGHGNVMFVLGEQVNGGQVYGTWPGLHVDQLYDRRDLEITTDYRQVLSEILIRRMGNPNLGTIFPGYSNYTPLGIVQGTDLTPNYDEIPTNPSGAPTPTATVATPGTLIPPAHTQTPTPTPVPTDPPVPTPTPTKQPNTGNPGQESEIFLPVINR